MENSSLNLQRKVILVTGAAKRIGRVIAKELYANGASVAIHYNGSEEAALATAAECGNAPTFHANLENVADIKRLFEDVVSKCGRIDGLVNNAARFTKIHPLDVTEEDWDFIHSVNLKALFFCCQQAALKMSKDGGRIVNISSLGGIRPWAHHAHYCASKAGVIMLTQALAKAFAPHISVNSVAPGVIPFENEEERVRSLVAATPACRAGEPEEIASAVLYFLSGPSFITGQTLAVDGGLSLR
jgi:NAD(P)-dependent dehydrogenase (short-subunit alcohol dehydrogenase family)